MAVYVGPALLLVRASYRREWTLPGGGIRRGELPEAAARRELAEETGIAATGLAFAGTACGIWDGRPDRVHFFELHLPDPPALRPDGREIIAAELVPWHRLDDRALTGSAAAYLTQFANPPRS